MQGTPSSLNISTLRRSSSKASLASLAKRVTMDPRAADMAAAAAAHHGDGANLRPGDPGTVARIGTGEIATAGMAGALEH